MLTEAVSELVVDADAQSPEAYKLKGDPRNSIIFPVGTRIIINGVDTGKIEVGPLLEE